MNKVTEAKKAAAANLIVRREETATMRSQANTATVLEDNPTLMRLRRTGSPGKDRRWRQAEHRAGREGPGRAGLERALIEIDTLRLRAILAFGHCCVDSWPLNCWSPGRQWMAPRPS
jgi:hypothetical protein